MDKHEIYEKLNEAFKSQLSESVMEQLEQSNGDVEFCKILADNNVDVEQFESIIKNSGLEFPTPGSRLSDELMGNISGGWHEINGRVEIMCPYCGASQRHEHSVQFFRTLWNGVTGIFDSGESGDYYRCKKCNHYFVATSDTVRPLD